MRTYSAKQLQRFFGNLFLVREALLLFIIYYKHT